MALDGTVETLGQINGANGEALRLEHDGFNLFGLSAPRLNTGGAFGTLSRWVWEDSLFVPYAFRSQNPVVSPAVALATRLGVPSSTSDARSLVSSRNGLLQYVATRGDIWRVKPAMPTYGDALVVRSNDGQEAYLFAADGRHLETRNARTGALIRNFEYDAAKRVTAVNRYDNAQTQVERLIVQRDGEGTPTQIVVDPDGAGAASTRAHDLDFSPDGNLLSLTDPADRTVTMSYEGTNPRLMTGLLDVAGRSKSYDFDSKSRITSQTDAPTAGQSTAGTFTFDYGSGTGSGNGLGGTTRTTPTGLTTHYGRQKNQDSSEANENFFPDQSVATSQRNVDGTTTVIARDGTRTTTNHQPDPTALPQEYNNFEQVTLPSSGVVHTKTRTKSGTPNTAGWMAQTSESECIQSTAGNLCTTSNYNSSTGIRTTQTPEGRVTTEYLDELDRINELLPPGSPRVRTVYDGDKVTAIVIDPDGVENNGDERQTLMEYDPSTALLAKVIDPLTHETIFGDYDLADRPGSITLPDAAQVLMTYDAEGNVATVTPPGKSPHGMTYGPKGRIESYTPPVGNNVQFFYDLDRRMDLIDFGLDSASQPTQVDFQYSPTTGELSTITSPTGTISVGYEDAHMTTLTAPSVNGSIVTSIDYDGFLPTALSWAGPVAGEVQWTYNDRFLIQTETIGALPETTVTYQYDKDGLVTQAGDLVIQRDPASGRVLSKTIGNIRETYQYNEFAELSRQRVVLLNAMGAEKETLYDVIYDDDGTYGDRDPLGRITRKTEWIVSGDEPGTTPRALDARTYDYGYNAEGRPWLESVAVNDNVVSSYGYDENGNRTSVELNWSQLGYSPEFDVSFDETETDYNEADQLLTYGTKSYAWNNFGQLESMTDSATNETTHYEYDLFGNLLSVALPDGRTIEYDVDGAGRRIGRRELDANGDEISFRGWIYRDLLRPIAEVNALGEVVARYVYSDGDGARQNGVGQLATRLGANQDTSLPFSGSNVPEAIELLDASGNVTQTLVLSTNQVGSVQLVTDAATGEVVQRIQYDEFGRVLSDSAPGMQPFGFAGGLYDAETKLVRFGARDYASDVGRWVARDPVRLRGGANGYLYVGSNPIAGRDFSGFRGAASSPPFWPPPVSPSDVIQEVCDLIFDGQCHILPDPFDPDTYDNDGPVECYLIQQAGYECCGTWADPYVCPPDNDENCDPRWQSCDDQCY